MTEPEPKWHVPYPDERTTAPPPDEQFRLPYSGEPQPHVFGKTTTDGQPVRPAAAPVWQQPGPYQPVPRPPGQLPSVGFIWLNILVFGWFLGLGLIYGVIKSIQGIVQSRKRGLSSTKYVVPLVAIAAVFLLLIIIGARVGSSGSGGTGGYGGG